MPRRITGARPAVRPRQMPLAVAAAPLVFVAAATLTLGAASAFARQGGGFSVAPQGQHPAREARLRAAFRGTEEGPPPETVRAMRRAQEEAAARAAAAYAAQHQMRVPQQQPQAGRAVATPGGSPAAQHAAHSDDWRWAGI